MDFDILNFYDRLKESWENKRGLLGGILLSIILYSLVMKFFLADTIDTNKNLFYIILPLLLTIVTFLLWVWSTNRFFLKLSSKTVCGIILITDEAKEKLVVNKIVSKVISKINKSELSNNVELKLLPSNFCETNEEIAKYYKNYSFLYDVLVRIFIESGNYESIEKIIIQKLSVTFAPKSNNKQKKIFFNIVDLIADMDLQIKSRDWEYSVINSGFDKKKYLGNIFHIILYYLGFYSIYTDRFEDALQFMSRIYNPRKTKVEIAKKEGNEIKLNLKPHNIAEARLATILVDLFFQSAIKNYYNDDTEKALRYFQELEILIKEHPAKFDQWINMARWSYELGNLKQAIKYTEKAKQLKPNSLQVFLNIGFFAILEGNVDLICDNYLKIFKYRKNPGINWVDVLDFQLKQKESLTGKERLLNFTTSFIEYVFISQNRVEFEQVIDTYKESEELGCFHKLGRKVLFEEMGSPKSSKQAGKKQRRKKSKRKTKKKRR